MVLPLDPTSYGGYGRPTYAGTTCLATNEHKCIMQTETLPCIRGIDRSQYSHNTNRQATKALE